MKIQIVTIIALIYFSSNSIAGKPVIDALNITEITQNQSTILENTTAIISDSINTLESTSQAVENAIEIKNNTLSQLQSLTDPTTYSNALLDLFDDNFVNILPHSRVIEEKIINGRKITPNNIDDINILYKDLYGDSFRERELKKPLVKKHIKDAKNDAISYSEYLITTSPKNIENIENSSIENDRTQSLKQSYDLKNKQLLTILIAMEENKLLLAKNYKSELLSQMQYYNYNFKQKEKTDYEKIKNKEGSMFKKKARLPREDGQKSFWDR
jgi:hypothetical protein